MLQKTIQIWKNLKNFILALVTEQIKTQTEKTKPNTHE